MRQGGGLGGRVGAKGVPNILSQLENAENFITALMETYKIKIWFNLIQMHVIALIKCIVDVCPYKRSIFF